MSEPKHDRALIIHGHFYQPPRENPWTGIVDREPSAAPAHDWNERIYRECYRPNAHARIVDEADLVTGIVSNYRLISFNFGPTLLSWLERHHPRTLRAIVQADRDSVRLRGHGNAIAQGYNHVILPLADDRDLRTQLLWGLAEFRHRYGRDAESLWLPETACDDRTLGALIDAGLRWAILAPSQALVVKTGDARRDVSDGSIDTSRAYRYLHEDGSGRSIALFFYDAAISRAIAFEGALSSSHTLLDRFVLGEGGTGPVAHAVTDGESYGHHFKFGDRCLAHALGREAERRGLWVTNYGELLDHHPPTSEVEINNGEDGKGTAWSCAHGLGRWFRDCGCHTGGKHGWTQAWRTPLRAALEALKADAARVFEERAGACVSDPWALRDAYIELLLDRHADRHAFFKRHGAKRLAHDRQIEVLALLESQRSSMTMFTSCGWFFSDLAGIETVQLLRYAGRMLDQLAELGVHGLEQPFVERLAEAKSNVPGKGNGADLYRTQVLPSRVEDRALAAHISLTSAVFDVEAEGEIGGRRYRIGHATQQRRGRTSCATACIELEQLATGHKSAFASCALFFGGVDLHAVLAPFESEGSFTSAVERILTELESRSLLSLLRVVQQELGPESFGIEHVLPSYKEAVGDAIFAGMKRHYAIQYEAMYEDARAAIAQLYETGLPLPRELRHAAELALGYRFDLAITTASRLSFDKGAYTDALAIAEEAARYGCALPKQAACRHFELHLGRLLDRVCAADPESDALVSALELLVLTERLSLDLDVERSQERLYRALTGGLETHEGHRELAEALSLSPRLFAEGR